jgi:hypothetical protein
MRMFKLKSETYPSTIKKNLNAGWWGCRQRWLTTIVACVLCALSNTKEVNAQSNVYYDQPTTQQYSELKQFGLSYIQVVTTGVSATGAGSFTFSTPEMNSPLYSPVREARAVVGLATGIGQCDLGGVKTLSPAAAQSLSLYFAEGQIATDLSDTEATVSHIEAVLNDPIASFSISGTSLISQGISPPVAVGGMSSGSTTYAVVGNDVHLLLDGLESAVLNYASGIDSSQDHKRLLQGHARKVDLVEQFAEQWCLQNGFNLRTYQVEVHFAKYGALPVVVGVFTRAQSSGFVLIDGVNGALAGPFVSRSRIDPTSLLSAHSAYITGSDFAVINVSTGCESPVADTRTLVPCPTPVPPGCVPGSTPPPGMVPITVPGNPVPGAPSAWSCTTTTAGVCVCKRTINHVPGTGTACPFPDIIRGTCLMKEDVICTATSTPCNCVGGAGGMPPGCGPTCSSEFWYWAQ